MFGAASVPHPKSILSREKKKKKVSYMCAVRHSIVYRALNHVLKAVLFTASPDGGLKAIGNIFLT